MSIEPIKYWLVSSQSYKKARNAGFEQSSAALPFFQSKLLRALCQSVKVCSAQFKNKAGFSEAQCTQHQKLHYGFLGQI